MVVAQSSCVTFPGKTNTSSPQTKKDGTDKPKQCFHPHLLGEQSVFWGYRQGRGDPKAATSLGAPLENSVGNDSEKCLARVYPQATFPSK